MLNKGNRLTQIASWNNKGTFSITQAEVYSCGKKQMVLNVAGSDECLGRNYRPGLDQGGFGHNCIFLFPEMTNEEAEAKALELGAGMIAHEIARLKDRIEFYRNRDGRIDEGFERSINKDIAELEASTPAFIHRDR